jgi:type I restriction enzyme S subunit
MSFPRYPSYKDSGVEWFGEVPDSWIVRRFKQIFAERDERSVAGEETLLSVSAYTGVTPRSEIIEEGDYLSRSESLVGYKVCHRDDLVMNIMLAWNRGLAISRFKGIVSPAYCVFTIIDGSVPAFLNYLVRTDQYTLYFKAFSSGVIDSRLRIYPQTFGSLFCCLPSYMEQQTIATFLDRETAKIDTLVAEQENLIDLLKEKRRAVISHAVTKGLDPTVPMKDSGIEWLGEVPAHWEIKRVKHLSLVISKGTTPTTVGAEFTSEGVRFLKAENITESGVSLEPEFFISEAAHTILSRSSLQEGDILVVIAGATTGKSAVLGPNAIPANTNQAVAFVRPSEKNMSGFVCLWLGTNLVRNLILLDSVQSAQPNLSMEDLGNIPIPIPVSSEILELERYIHTETDKLNTLTAEAQHAIDLLKERRSALISAAVTGKIDVRGYHAQPQPIV